MLGSVRAWDAALDFVKAAVFPGAGRVCEGDVGEVVVACGVDYVLLGEVSAALRGSWGRDSYDGRCKGGVGPVH